MITPVKWLLALTACSLLMGCGARNTPPPDDTESIHAPSAPKKTDYVKNAVAADYRTGMWMYRQSLITYVGKLTDYINYIAILEGFTDNYGRPCRFPFTWEAIPLPDTPAPVTTDPETVNGILADHVRELRRLIRATNEKYATCVK